MILIDKYVKFLAKHKITEKQLLILMLMYTNRQDLVNVYAAAFDAKELATQEDKDVLRQRGLLTLDRSKRYLLTDLFTDLFVDKHEATDEVFAHYPVYTLVNGRKIPLIDMDRNIFANLYSSSILNFREEHQDVIKDIKYAKKHDLLNIGIQMFLKSKYWLNIRKIRLSAESVEAPDRAT